MDSREIKLVVLKNIERVGKEVNKHLGNLSGKDKSYMVDVEVARFSNGEGKAKFQNTVRGDDVYILSDVGNYGLSYLLHGKFHEVSPDEHFQDIKRVIAATCGHADKVHLIMPLLYQARQHKRKGRESLDCAIALQELERLGVEDIITFDAHDPNVSNAIPLLPFENFYPTNIILEKLIELEKDNINNLLVVSPDMGAVTRARYYAEVLGCDVGVFYKRRDLSRLVNGKNPIVEHVYLGSDVCGKNIIVVDDMIASGASMIDVASELKERGANSVYFITTFALFTEGYESFREASERGLFNKLYTTNLSYIPTDIKNQSWFEEVDCSSLIANIIYNIHKGKSLECYHKPSSEVLTKVRRR